MKYWKASRPYTFTAALVPVLLGTAVAKLQFPQLNIHWLNFVLVLLGCVGAQAISNLVNDLADVKSGLDKPGSGGRYHGILSGDCTWQEIFKVVIVLGIISLAIGIYLASVVGWSLLWLILISAFLAIEYTAPPLKLKYRALGDFTVLLTFGLGMVFGAYIVQTYNQPGANQARPLLALLAVSLPSALHVIAILQANNHRDRESDQASGATTLANLLSFPVSKALLLGELIVPYGLVLLAIPFGWLPPYALLVFVTVPPLLAILRPLFADDYRRAVPSVAKLHGQFGLLMAAAIVLQIAFPLTGLAK
jgi:1,4-dihydroxy-2-naphthoate octaprenyltransferase